MRDARFDWVGGAFLRQDWLAAVGIGVCMLRRERFALAGALFAYGAMVPVCEKAADKAQELGKSVEIIDPRSLVPLDEDLILLGEDMRILPDDVREEAAADELPGFLVIDRNDVNLTQDID